ncbi:uncharacterized protein LOC100832638 isoform X2 [Brachypodium distachyon]|uniref:uncharacterized protein LOC100832638 isoform X2 n=1 Tax=Brachypodium distachyon TaxID=15368 RepID=UPI00071CC28C|nr:uncharacterized protein LOC100832638 isoform X2 [Brachypodium distachyon]|eukprot:XP_014754582.1 uncharacterized protein LOC100832638 isoform X2 [Brachypodium distachyon]
MSSSIPDADELDGARSLALIAFTKLSMYESTTTSSSSSVSALSADLPPLLHCCFQLLPCLDHDLATRCVSRLCSFLHSILSGDPDPAFVPALEVFFQIFMNTDQLRRFIMVEQKGSEVSPPWRYELGVRLELMSHYFISFVHDEVGFEQFFSALSWSEKGIRHTPEFGLAGAISLVRRSYWFSMPVIPQAHFVLLASRCVGSGDLDMHLQVFRHAMEAYLIYLPELSVFDRCSTVKSPFSCFANRRLLNSPIPDATSQKLNCQINRFLLFCKAHSDDSPHVKEKDIFDVCVSFIEENQHVFPEQSRKDAVTVVKIIVYNIMDCAKQKEMHRFDSKVSEEIIYIAAVLKLIGSSFLEILHCSRQMRVPDDKNHENHIVVCISETIRLLGRYEADGLPIGDLFGLIVKPVDRERASVVMLFHFASLLVFCLRMGFGFLWRGCIIMMMLAMNLVIDEERSLGLFRFLIGSKDFAISSIGQNGNLKGSTQRKSSTAIALQFNNLHKRLSRDKVGHDFSEDSSHLAPFTGVNLQMDEPFLRPFRDTSRTLQSGMICWILLNANKIWIIPVGGCSTINSSSMWMANGKEASDPVGKSQREDTTVR